MADKLVTFSSSVRFLVTGTGTGFPACTFRGSRAREHLGRSLDTAEKAPRAARSFCTACCRW